MASVPGHGHDSFARSFPLLISASRANGFMVDPGGSGTRVADASFRIASTRRVRTSTATAASDDPTANIIASTSLRRIL
jgi:hypothetical protein